MAPSHPRLDLDGPLVLAGAGKMGSALLAGWRAQGLDTGRVMVIEPQPSEYLRGLALGARLVPTPDPAWNRGHPVRAVVLAVKPQIFADAAAALRPLIAPGTLVVSIMAGQPIDAVVRACGGAVVRAMPNTPAAIARGITVAVAASTVTPAQRALAHSLLAATGSVEWIEDEGLMDAVTAVSGSGPAYVFLLVEELARAGVTAGLPERLAMRLARETVAGSGELLHRAHEEAATLRKNVTSPGGTTEAALRVLMGHDGLEGLMRRAVEAATLRSRELGLR